MAFPTLGNMRSTRQVEKIATFILTPSNGLPSFAAFGDEVTVCGFAAGGGQPSTYRFAIIKIYDRTLILKETGFCHIQYRLVNVILVTTMHGLLRSGLFFPEFCLAQTDDGGQQGDKKNRDDNQLEVVLDHGDATEEVAEQREQC